MPMRYLALATDYDGTLATDGIVDAATVAALERAVASGRRLILVTGRQLDDLTQVFPRLDLFHRVVAENGALLYRPATREEKQLGEAPPQEFVAALRTRGVQPLSVGRAIVATWEPNQTIVLDVIRALGLELQVIFNKGAVMILPAGVNKGTGLAAALEELDLSPHNTVAIGDAENDHAFLSLCECSAAVANALPLLKERADIVTGGDHGAGVVELVDLLVTDDLREAAPHLGRHDLVLGTHESGEDVRLPPYGVRVLVAGPSGSGKSTLATGLLEQLAENGYQTCILDPEGDYIGLSDTVTLGDEQHEPTSDEVLQVLEHPGDDVVISLLGVPMDDRPARGTDLLAVLLRLQGRTGRPHWLVTDEAHHLLPAATEPESISLAQQFPALLLITVHPGHMAPAALGLVDVVLAVGDAPWKTLNAVARAIGLPKPETPPGVQLRSGEALAWFCRTDTPPFHLRARVSRAERNRHQRKYMQGDLADKSFYFRGPDGRLNLRAQNLALFLQIADGIDDATWLYHLRNGDYTRWFEEAIKDRELASLARQFERAPELSPAEERKRLRETIEQRYTLPA